jgi:transposase
VADEDARSLQREYRTLVEERKRSSNRIKGLLASQGVVAPRIDGQFLPWLAAARLWDGSAIPSGMRARVEREFARWRFTRDQVLALARARPRSS